MRLQKILANHLTLYVIGMTGAFLACPQLNVNFKRTKNADQNLAVQVNEIYKERTDASSDEVFSTLNK